MAFVKKTWKDRIAEFPTRRRLTKSNGDSELVTVAREEGTLSQEGDAFSAENMNDLESRVDNAISEINSNLTKFELLESHTNPSVELKSVNIPSGAKSVLFSYVGTNGTRYDLIHVPLSLKSDNVTYVSYTNGGTSYVMTYYIKENTIEFGCQSVEVNAGLVAEVSFFN